MENETLMGEGVVEERDRECERQREKVFVNV